MEAVNKAIHTASHAIWGENSTQPSKTTSHEHEEPISGVQGKGAAGDPYDAGNREEQPEAPATDDNTAPQDPKLDGQSRNANSADAVTGSTTEESTPNLATATATATAGSSSSSSAEPSSANSNSNAGGENKEQRDQTAMGDHDHVSKEALQGPQGPAPRPAEEFEKDLNKSSKDEQSSEPADTSKGGGEKAHHSGNGKSNPMSKMKETLNKVTHPRHGGRQ